MSKVKIVINENMYDLVMPSGTPSNLEIFIRDGRVWSRMETEQVDIDVTAEVYEIHLVIDNHLEPPDDDEIAEQIKLLALSPIPKIRYVSDGEALWSRLYDGNTGKEMMRYCGVNIAHGGIGLDLNATLTFSVSCGQAIQDVLGKLASERIVFSLADGCAIYFKDRMKPRNWHEYLLMQKVQEAAAATGV